MGKKKTANSSPANSPRNRELPPQFLANQFRPGQSGNPSGRPKTKPITDRLWEMVEEATPEQWEEFKRTTWRKMLSDRVIGHFTLEAVLNRLEGRLPVPVELSGEVDVRHVIEEARKRLQDDDAPILDAEEIPQLTDGDTGGTQSKE